VRIKVSSPDLKERARSLRRDSTAAEAFLWHNLRNRKLVGLQFRRQRPIGPYIVDFYCPELGLVVEVDGPNHSLANEAAADEERTAFLIGRGLQVIRFTNEEVLTQNESVLERIGRTVSPSP
jgi:very-short-patch-repair endonuclease